MVEQRIVFNQNFNKGTVHIIFEDIGSQKVNFSFSGIKAIVNSDEDIIKQKGEDFSDLLDMYKNDEFLLDETWHGVYVKDRKLYAENNKLNASYEGIFKNYSMDEGEDLKVIEDSITITFKKEKDIEIVETNGKMIINENLITVFQRINSA